MSPIGEPPFNPLITMENTSQLDILPGDTPTEDIFIKIEEFILSPKDDNLAKIIIEMAKSLYVSCNECIHKDGATEDHCMMDIQAQDGCPNFTYSDNMHNQIYKLARAIENIRHYADRVTIRTHSDHHSDNADFL